MIFKQLTNTSGNFSNADKWTRLELNIRKKRIEYLMPSMKRIEFKNETTKIFTFGTKKCISINEKK